MNLHVDVTRLMRRHLAGIHHTGIDRVNLEYARWAHRKGGHLCIRQGTRLKTLSGDTWGEKLLGTEQPGNLGAKRHRRLALYLRSLALRQDIPDHAQVAVSTHSWLGCEDTWNWTKSKKCRSFVFIHDLIPLQYPEYSQPQERENHERRVLNTLRWSAGIIVNSRCTESALRSHAETLGLPMPPILVAPLGHEFPKASAASAQFEISSPYFVVLGTIEPRKNHLLLLTLWRELVKRHGPATPRLVLLGRRGWECEQVVDLLERCTAIKPYVIEKNDASDEDLATFISGARALLMPSYAEGFGLPVQEALALGTPVISSPLPAIREFARDIPEYADTYDGVTWMRLIESYTGNESPLRRAQLQRLNAFQYNSWKVHFDLVEAFMKPD
jgi:glycosyltransferase involved in cell wall biosynthesis